MGIWESLSAKVKKRTSNDSKQAVFIDPHDEGVYILELDGARIVSMNRVRKIIQPRSDEGIQWGTTD